MKYRVTTITLLSLAVVVLCAALFAVAAPVAADAPIAGAVMYANDSHAAAETRSIGECSHHGGLIAADSP